MVIDGFRNNITAQLQNVDNKFKEISDKDYVLGQQSVVTEVASINSREMQNVEGIFNDLYTKVDVDEAYRIDAKPYIERPFFVEHITWNVNHKRYHLLNNTVMQLPGDVIRSNESLLNAMKIGAYYRADLVLNISVAGTITHSGCIVVAALPPMPSKFSDANFSTMLNTMLSGPHAFLFANEATTVNLTVPWYCNSDMATLDMDKREGYASSVDITPSNGNYATLVFMVLNPLAPSVGSSTELNIIVEACFKHLDILVPTPRYVGWSAQGFGDDLKGLATGLLDHTASGLKTVAGDAIDGLRKVIFGWTGLHNPNVPQLAERDIIVARNQWNSVESTQYIEKLDPYDDFNRICKSPIFGSTIDEMRTSYITAKKQYLGTFIVSNKDVVGKNYWSRPISPFQGGTNSENITIANNIELMHLLSRGWRGKLKLHIQSVMNNKQQVKLKVIKMYNPSKNVSSLYPIYQTIVNAPTHLMEFTQGGQVQEIELPYLCRNDITPCSREPTTEGVFHGMYYIYLAQPLANSDGSPTEIEFNVYMSGGEDLQFYGYSTQLTELQGFKGIFQPQRQKNIERKTNHHVLAPRDVTVNELISHFSDRDKDRLYRFNPKLKGDNIIRKGHKLHYYLPRPEVGMLKKEEYSSEEYDAQNLESEESSELESRNDSELEAEEEFNEEILEPIVEESERFEENDDDYTAESLEVMNEPQKQSDLPIGDIYNITHFDRLRPIVSMRDILRRVYKAGGANSTIPPGFDSPRRIIPLASVVGELPNAPIYSPITCVSNMYYGKTVGFKVMLKVTPLGKDEINVIDSKNLSIKVHYIPPNFTWDFASSTVLASSINNNIDSNPYDSVSAIGTPFPFPLSAIQAPTAATDGSLLYEVVIPDVTYFKFMGSPSKFYPTDGSFLGLQLATADFGNLAVTITNNGPKTAVVGFEVFVALTDESRLGLHCIAPVVTTSLKQNAYWGTPTDYYGPPSEERNVHMYRGGFL